MIFQSTFLALLMILQLSTSASAPMTEPERRLLFERIVEYDPTTQVTDHAALDLDQRIMDQQLALGSLIHARNVYEKGGHSYSIAQLTLMNSPPNGRLAGWDPSLWAYRGWTQSCSGIPLVCRSVGATSRWITLERSNGRPLYNK
jgi:hypothetical protein